MPQVMARKQLIQEIDALPPECFPEVLHFVGYLRTRKAPSVPDTMLLSQAALAKNWDTAEEDAAWADL
jgi:hypothetical protein